MEKSFNVAGPCNPQKNYMISTEIRCHGINALIDQEQYFVIHAARQSGKTTMLMELANKLNSEGKYYCLYCTLESVQGISEPEKGIPSIIYEMKNAIKYHGKLPADTYAVDANMVELNTVLSSTLTDFCIKLDKPLVILFDEVDCLSNGTLISFLRQLRSGYVKRASIPFVHSVGLIGMRNIRDYKYRIRDEKETLGSASPFNIVTKTMTLKNFTKEETITLYSQHTQDTGQIFSSDVIEHSYYYTQGQPWLVNAIAREIVIEILDSDFSQKILVEHVDQAVENITHRRETHIDSLLERLKEERVRKVVEPVIMGDEKGFDYTDDDYQYVLDLGLIKNVSNILTPSNPIYSDVIIRKLSSEPQMSMDSIKLAVAPHYIVKGKKLDMKKLFKDFQAFWRENSEIWRDRFQYKEAAPHLVLMAFLQRIVNSGGRIERELATGTRRIDLCINYQNYRYPVEMKIRRSNKTLKEGQEQLSGYMETLNCKEGWLVIFDQRTETTWKSKLFYKTSKVGGKTFNIVGC